MKSVICVTGFREICQLYTKLNYLKCTSGEGKLWATTHHESSAIYKAIDLAICHFRYSLSVQQTPRYIPYLSE